MRMIKDKRNKKVKVNYHEVKLEKLIELKTLTDDEIKKLEENMKKIAEMFINDSNNT
jgi:hypothetical protein